MAFPEDKFLNMETRMIGEGEDRVNSWLGRWRGLENLVLERFIMGDKSRDENRFAASPAVYPFLLLSLPLVLPPVFTLSPTASSMWHICKCLLLIDKDLQRVEISFHLCYIFYMCL